MNTQTQPTFLRLTKENAPHMTARQRANANYYNKQKALKMQPTTRINITKTLTEAPHIRLTKENAPHMTARQRANANYYNKQKLLKQKAAISPLDEAINTNNIEKLNELNKNSRIIYTLDQATKIFNLLNNKGYYIIFNLRKDNKVQEPVIYTHRYYVNDNTKNSIISILTNKSLDTISNAIGSGKYDDIIQNDILSINILKVEDENTPLRTTTAGLYTKLNTSLIDLTRYQIYNKIQIEEGLTSNNENCLIYSLDQQGLPIELVYGLNLELKTIFTARTDLKKIADKLNIIIVLHEFIINEYISRNIITKHGTSYPDKQEYHIAVYDEHYFAYEEVNFTESFINNYVELSNRLDLSDEKILNKARRFKEFYGKYIKYFNENEFNNHKTNSLYLIRKLDNLNLLIKDDVIEQEILKYRLPSSINLDKVYNEIQYKELKEPKKHKTSLIFIADTECEVKPAINTNVIHTPILICIKELSKGDPVIFKGIDCIDKMLNYIVSKTSNNFIPRVYFHNLKYDIHVILHKFKNIINILESDGITYTYTIIHNKKMIEFYDSYKLIRSSIRDMPKTFNLSKEFHKNEAIAYDYHTLENINSNEEIDINIYRDLLEDKTKIIFDELMNNKKTFNPSKYYIDYCIYDVLILEQSLLVFDKTIRQIFNKSIFDYITISSLGFSLIENLILDVPMAAMNLRSFIDEAIYGGRVICSKVKNHIKKDIQDFDAVSMYPSAIVRLCNDYGIPTCAPRRINNFQDIIHNPNLYYIVKIKITKINKKLDIPIVCLKTKEKNEYLNEIITPITVTIDKITLEDYIRYQNIEYEFIEGISYSLDNSNKKLKDLIIMLFQERLKAKKENNKVLSEVYKLLLNSIYGKTIQKAHNDKTVIKSKDKLDKYVLSYSQLITDIIEINQDNFMIKQYNYDNSYSYNIIGMMILSMSKRMMNEVFNCANLENINIYYTDTDSMHIDANGIDKVALRYKSLYSKELIGKNLEQFHCDFELEGCKNIVSKECIIIDKKIYIDKLEGINQNNDKIIDYHYRLKGISKKALDNHIKEHYNNDPIMFYKQLLKDDRDPEQIIMNFNKYNVSFDITHRNVCTKSIGSFIRSI